MAHAFLSPSGAPAWLRCHIKPWRERDLPDESSEFANEGTAAHFLRDACLQSGQDAADYIGKGIVINADGTVGWFGEIGWLDDHSFFKVDLDMAREVQKSIDVLRELAKDGTLYPEQQLAIEHITGEQGATGTCDTVIVKETEIIIDDLKYGRGVPVSAELNEQLLMYGSAALEEYDLLGEIKTVRLRISQPRLNNDSEWTISTDELRSRIAEIRKTADKINTGPWNLPATPGVKQCQFCKAKSNCDEYRESVLSTIGLEFDDLDKGELAVSPQEVERILANAFGVKPKDVEVSGGAVVVKPNIRPALEASTEQITSKDDSHLATCMDAIDLVEGWCKAIRAEIERRLLAGTFTDPRYKLVEGKRGARAWVSEAQAEAAMKAMRLKVDQMYDLKVISPTSAEKVLAADHPRKWAKLQDHITQSQGRPSVAPLSDKRKAIEVAVSFEPIEGDV